MTLMISAALLVSALAPGATGSGKALADAPATPPVTQAATGESDAEAIRRRVAEGQQVRITDDEGREWRGRIQVLARDTLTLVLKDRQQRDVPYGNIIRIDRPHDSLANGALIGFAAGAGLGLFAVISEENAECQPGGFFSCGDPTAGAYVVAPLILGGLGSAVGVAIDALIRRDPNLYRRSGEGRVTLAPAIRHGVRGFSMSVRW